jgi:predicted amidohydrolase
MKCDIAIRNGFVVDPHAQREAIGDVFIENGIVIDCTENMEARVEYDASGMHVFPGLIDYHTHLFWGGTEIGVPADVAMIPQGVTTAIDAGSAGVSNFPVFAEKVAYGSCMRIKAFLNLSPTGLTTSKYHENINPKYWDKGKIKEILKRYPDIIMGLKIRISRGIADGQNGEELKAAVAIAEELETRLAVHSTDPTGTMEEVAASLRSGDILVHCFHGTGNTILDNQGKVLPVVNEARQRGVIMDAANGGNHWTFSVAETAIRQGFFPDVISTDITTKTLFRDPVFGLPYIMSKYLMMGVPLGDIVARCTAIPAKLMGLEGRIGTLAPGASADVSVFRLTDEEINFTDTKNEVRRGNKILVPQMTVVKGNILFRSY